MKKLLDFLLRKKHWFLFIVFEVISIVLVYQNKGKWRDGDENPGVAGTVRNYAG